MRRPKCTSGKNFYWIGETVFVQCAQTVTGYREKALRYDEVVSGPTIYTYVLGNPVSLIDPLGLDPANGQGFSTHYGNWCGKNWSGGQSGSIISTNPKGPVDSLDSCCMAHDYCYAKIEDKDCPLSKAEKKKAFDACDATVGQCSRALSNNGTGWPSSPSNSSDAYFYKQKLQKVF